LRTAPALQPDTESALQKDEDSVDRDALLDEGGARRNEPLGAGGKHPLDVIIVQLAEEEENFSHAARSSLLKMLKGAGALFSEYRPLTSGDGPPPNRETPLPSEDEAPPSGERPSTVRDGPPPQEKGLAPPRGNAQE